MMRFKVKAGKHSDRDGTTYGPGEVVEDSRDLSEVFGPFKFERLPDGKAQDEDEEPVKKGKKGKKLKLKKKAPAEDARGVEVTADCPPVVAESGLHVFRRGDRYHVFDGDSTTPLNKKGLDKGEVEAYVTKYLEE